jgi:hypothetical protein
MNIAESIAPMVDAAYVTQPSPTSCVDERHREHPAEGETLTMIRFKDRAANGDELVVLVHVRRYHAAAGATP